MWCLVLSFSKQQNSIDICYCHAGGGGGENAPETSCLDVARQASPLLVGDVLALLFPEAGRAQQSYIMMFIGVTHICIV